jgi:hypothetical protein
LSNFIRGAALDQVLTLLAIVTGCPFLLGPLECFVNPAHYSLSIRNNPAAI